MQLHKAQQFTKASISHLPGLFRKVSEMDWERKKKSVHFVLDGDVRQIETKIEGEPVYGFVNGSFCFFGIRFDEGFKPLDPDVARELMTKLTNKEEDSHKDSDQDQGSDEQFERSRAQAELGKLLQERPALSGSKLAGNTRKIRNLVRKYDLECPLGI